jgi:hypothetical protein
VQFSDSHVQISDRNELAMTSLPEAGAMQSTAVALDEDRLAWPKKLWLPAGRL